MLIMMEAVPMANMNGKEKSWRRIGGAPLYTIIAAPLPQLWISSRNPLDTSSGLHKYTIILTLCIQGIRQKTKVFFELISVSVPSILVIDDGGVSEGRTEALHLNPSLFIHCRTLKSKDSALKT